MKAPGGAGGAPDGAGLAFIAGGRRWAIPVTEVREAARLGNLAPLPGAPARLAGVTFVRGEPLGVLDVARQLGGDPGQGTMLVVLDGRPWALLVERVEGMVAEGVTLLDPAELIGG